jgi:hypothetical protein
VSSLFWRVICQSTHHEDKRSKMWSFWPFFLFVTQGGISHGNKKSSFPFSSIGIKYVGSFVGLHIAHIQFLWLFVLNVGFSWPNSICHIYYIVVPMISLVELAACTKTKFSKHWEILSWLLKSWVWWVLAPPCLLRCVRITMAAVLLNCCQRSCYLRWSG